MQRLSLWLGVLSIVLGVILGFGCGSKGKTFDPNDGGDDDALADEGGCLLSNCTDPDGMAGGVIDINPKDPTLAITAGMAIPTQAFTATLEGMDVTSNVVWAYDPPIVGDIPTGNTFVPTGKAAGLGTLSATLGNAKGSTTVTVTIDKVVNTGGLSMQQQMQLNSPNGGADPMQFLYPSDKTFFPLEVLSPEMMWNGAAANDVYKVKFTEKYLTYTEFFSNAPPPSRHIVPQIDWKMIEDSGAGPTTDPLKVEITRLSGSTAYQPKTFTWHVVKGKLYGSVYYWELPLSSGNGRILKIKPGDTMVTQVLQTSECWGCHTVSRDGKQILGNFDTLSYGDVLIDNSKNPAVKTNVTFGTATFSAFNPDGKYALMAHGNYSGPHTVDIVDTKTGMTVKASAFSGVAGEPAWSPDGKKVAAITSISDSGWPFDSQTGDLTVGDANGNTFSNFKTIVQASSLPGGRPAYPSFSPNSAQIAFGNPSAGSRSTGSGSLWIIDTSGQNRKELKTAASDLKSFNPVYAPLRAGGYSWIVYITRRDYGNRLVGANNQQLWITAIDDPPTASDPSHPPFYLRGQEDNQKSENAYYALDPCKMKGQSCESGVDCCTGQCIKVNGMYVCGDPMGCSQVGNSCTVAADCCDSAAQCIDGFCQKPPPK